MEVKKERQSPTKAGFYRQKSPVKYAFSFLKSLALYYMAQRELGEMLISIANTECISWKCGILQRQFC